MTKKVKEREGERERGEKWSQVQSEREGQRLREADLERRLCENLSE